MGERRLFQGLVSCLGALLVAAFLVGLRQEAPPTPSTASPGISRFVWHAAPRALQDGRFTDAADRSLGFGDFRGRVVLVNLWATWCAPCLEEMPTLDRLAGTASADMAVVAISLDRERETARRWLEAQGLRRLALYHDPSMSLLAAFSGPGLPLTILIDREGREVGRLAGAADWSGPEAQALFARARGAPQGPS